jgi:hypothetical protein
LRRSHIPKTSASLCLGLALILSMTACLGRGGGSVTTYADGRGALIAGGSGGFAMAAPGGVPWTGSFGEFALCSQKPGAKITLDSVSYETENLTHVKVLLHTYALSDLKGLSPSKISRYTSLGSSVGQPPDFVGGEADHQLGSYTSNLKGVAVSQTCDDERKSDEDVSGGAVPDQPVQDLIFVAQTNALGGQFKNVYINYTVDGQRARIKNQWQMTMCGSAPAIRRQCS